MHDDVLAKSQPHVLVVVVVVVVVVRMMVVGCYGFGRNTWAWMSTFRTNRCFVKQRRRGWRGLTVLPNVL